MLLCSLVINSYYAIYAFQHISRSMCPHTFLYTCPHIYIYVYVCVYVYIYIYTHTSQDANLAAFIPLAALVALTASLACKVLGLRGQGLGAGFTVCCRSWLFPDVGGCVEHAKTPDILILILASPMTCSWSSYYRSLNTLDTSLECSL